MLFAFMNKTRNAVGLAVLLALNSFSAELPTISVDASSILHPVSRYLTGACLEDVNHEVYGGIDSQMVFGESFAEPAAQIPLGGFDTFGGRWTVAADGSLQAVGSNGSKIIRRGPPAGDGEIGVEVMLTEAGGGNGGLILKVSQPGDGADAFTGYEVSLERPGFLVLGRHRQNWEPLRRVPCEVPVNEWIRLCVRLSGRSIAVSVNGREVTQFEDTEHPLEGGAVGLRIWQHEVRFRHFFVSTAGLRQDIPLEHEDGPAGADAISGMWRAVREGGAEGSFSLVAGEPFAGRQSQRVCFVEGTGVIGIENQGLNRLGMNFAKGKPYEGYVHVRGAGPAEFFVALENRDGSRTYAEKRLKVDGGEWQKVGFKLVPKTGDPAGRLAIKLKRPGILELGYAFLQPGEWGRFKGLPVRRDVGQGLVDQGLTVLRLGGCMANAAEYRWKKMVGPRERRPPYEGWWHPHSSNGWGIFDFLNYCEAAGFLAVPDLNASETPEDMADFVEYVNGPANSKWGRQRAADGHPAPYHLKYLQIGNEEAVNDSYFAKFKGIAEAVWGKDPEIILVVGDFAYGKPIVDPFNFTGAAGGITTLAVQQKILQLARSHNREVWFDVHIGTEGPRPDFGGTFSYIDALTKIADGARFRVVIFEFNANNPTHRRGLANAAAIGAVERDGRLPIAASANCLQPDGQNDNGWDQGLLFLNPSQVWYQSPGHVTRMVSRNYQPLAVKSAATGDGGNLDVSARRDEAGRRLVLQVVNFSERSVQARIELANFIPARPVARVEELSGPLNARNTAAAPERIKPRVFEWRHRAKDGAVIYEFPPYSFTVIRFE